MVWAAAGRCPYNGRGLLSVLFHPPAVWKVDVKAGAEAVTLDHDLGDGGLSRTTLQRSKDPALDHLPPDFQVSEKQTFNLFAILLFWLF